MIQLPPILHVRVYGHPVPQPRPRARAISIPTKDGPPILRAHIYTPDKSSTDGRSDILDWKRTIQAQVLPHKPAAPIGTAIALTALFYLPRPQSAPKRVKLPTKKPDLDNLLKAVKDAIKGIVYVDDSQIVSFTAMKHYDPAPGVLIHLEHVVDDRPAQAEIPLASAARS